MQSVKAGWKMLRGDRDPRNRGHARYRLQGEGKLLFQHDPGCSVAKYIARSSRGRPHPGPLLALSAPFLGTSHVSSISGML